jgi:hypothetical protein
VRESTDDRWNVLIGSNQMLGKRIVGDAMASFVSPWFVMTLKHADIGYRIGALEASIARSTIDDLSSRLG